MNDFVIENIRDYLAEVRFSLNKIELLSLDNKDITKYTSDINKSLDDCNFILNEVQGGYYY